MYYELSKKDKKVARQLIDKGLLIEFTQGLNNFSEILEDWKNGKVETKDTYHKLFRAIKNFDKHVALRYDGIGGSRYLETVIAQLVDGLYDISEADNFNQEVREDTLRCVKFRKEF